MGWRDRAACAEGDLPDLWFSDHGDDINEARAICGRCPVRDDCLAEAMKVDEDGIWGGLNRDQRRRLADAKGIKLPHRISAADYAPCGTAAGARKHYRHRTPVCDPCKQADLLASAERKRRRTG